MVRDGGGRAAWAARLVLVAATAAHAGGLPAVSFDEYDALPQGDVGTLAMVYAAAEEVPGVAALPAAHKRGLLDVVTERFKNRLVNRPPGASRELLRSHVERLSVSNFAERHPQVVAQACAQYGFVEGPCARHAPYVRRAMLIEEMLATGRLSLADLETELVGEPRPPLRSDANRTGPERG